MTRLGDQCNSAGEVAVGSLRRSLGYGDTEHRIVTTLRAMLPDAAASYEQAVMDLRGPVRVSWRGAAVEFREVVGEVLDLSRPTMT